MEANPTNSPSRIAQKEQTFDIAEFAGNLHNETVEAFFKYAKENNLEGYNEEVETKLEEFIFSYTIEQFENNNELKQLYYQQSYSVNTSAIDSMKSSIFEYVDANYEYTYTEDKLQEYLAHSLPSYKTEQELGVYQAIVGIAIATNRLWSHDWDYATYPIGKLYVCASAEENEETKEKPKDPKEKEKEEQQNKEDQNKLKRADIEGAFNGAIEGVVVTVSGGPVVAAWGALLGASAGAAINSAKEAILQRTVDKSSNIEQIHN